MALNARELVAGVLCPLVRARPNDPLATLVHNLRPETMKFHKSGLRLPGTPLSSRCGGSPRLPRARATQLLPALLGHVHKAQAIEGGGHVQGQDHRRLSPLTGSGQETLKICDGVHVLLVGMEPNNPLQEWSKGCPQGFPKIPLVPFVERRGQANRGKDDRNLDRLKLQQQPLGDIVPANDLCQPRLSALFNGQGGRLDSVEAVRRGPRLPLL